MPVQGDLCDQLLAKLARLFVVVAAARLRSIVLPVRCKLLVAHGLLNLGQSILVALISEEIVGALVGDVDWVFGVGHGAVVDSN